jgi:hypothetical protein
LPPLGAAAAQDDGKPSAPKQLWKKYPLDPTASPGAQPVAASPSATAQPDRAPVAESHPAGGGGALMIVLLLLALCAVAAGTTFLLVRRRRRPEPAAAAVLPAPRLVATAPAIPARVRDASGRFARATPRRAPSARVIAMASPPPDPAAGGPRAGGERPAPIAGASPAPREPSALSRVPTVAEASPPDRARTWTAEIEWRESDAEGVFRVVARPTAGRGKVTIAESARLDWPPSGPASVAALRQAAEQLEASLLAAGWKPLPQGHEWYAKRFAWEADSARPSEAPPPQPGRFERGPTWPPGTFDLWRCEIRWDAGYINSSFKAMVFPPGKRRGRAVGESATFKWMIMDSPNPEQQATVAELRRLGSALVAVGWQPVGQGTDWYSGRFVWRGQEPPPDHVELAPAEGETEP